MADKKLIHYCDRCGNNNGLPIQQTKYVKSTCQICGRYVGPLNEAVEEDIIPNDISSKAIEIGSFSIEQMPNFLPGMNPSRIHPNLPYDIKSQDLVLYFPSIEDDDKNRKTLIIANPKVGEQFRVILPESRKSKSVGRINAE